MSIGDKEVYPRPTEYDIYKGLTYREWLIGMLASNKAVCGTDYTGGSFDYGVNAKMIINQADAIIKQLDKESKK